MPALRYGNYEVLEGPDGKPWTLGTGGFGCTYKARHRYLDKPVALKVISEALLDDEDATARFLREAQVVHKLVHPNIAHVDDFGELDGTLYYAMEFCEGGDLVQWRKSAGASVPLEDVAACARQTAAALRCAHDAGWVHRDVKPGNIMLATREPPVMFKLVDFGLVKSSVPRDPKAGGAVTMDGRHFFTVAYASPEQLREETLDGRTDIFSLGMTLWFLLLGIDPEDGALGRVIARRLGPESYVDQLPTHIGESFRSLLAWMLEKERDQRCASAADLLAALDHLKLPDPTEYQSAVQGWSPSAAPPTESIYTNFELHEAGATTTELGPLFEGVDRRTNQPVAVTFLTEELVANQVRMAEVRNTTSLLRSNVHPSLLGVLAFEHYSEGWAIVRERANGVKLRQVLKSNGVVSFRDALRVLSPLAETLDFVDRLKAPGLALSADDIVVEPARSPVTEVELAALARTPVRSWPPINLRVQPLLYAKSEPASPRGTTQLPQAGSDSRVEFSSLLYRLVSGRPAPAAARQASTAYLPIAGLSENGNRRLAAGLANQTDTNSCLELLRSICATEGVDEDEAGAPTAPAPALPSVRSERPPTDDVEATLNLDREEIAPRTGAGRAAETVPAASPKRSEGMVPTLSRNVPPEPVKARTGPAPLLVPTTTTAPRVAPQASPRVEPPAQTPSPPPPAAKIPNPPAGAAPPLSPTSAPQAAVVLGRETMTQEANPRRNQLLLAAAGVVLLAAGAGIWHWTKGNAAAKSDAPSELAPAAPPPIVSLAPAPAPTARPLAIPTPLSIPTPPPVAVNLSLPYARIPSNATFVLGDTPVLPSKANGAHRLEIQPADFNKTLTISAPGYGPYIVDKLATLRESEIKSMTRETGTLLISSADGRISDYSRLKIVWKSAFPAGTERQPSEVNEQFEEIARLEGTSIKEIKLPTGEYELVAMGGEGDGKSIKPRILSPGTGPTQIRTGPLKISIPPSFSGIYDLRQELPGAKGSYRLFELSIPKISTGGTMRQTDYLADGSKVRTISFTIFSMEMGADGKLQAKVESTKAEPAIRKKLEFRAQFSIEEGKLRCESVPGELEKNRFRFDLSRSASGDTGKK